MSKSARVGGFMAKVVGKGSAKLWNGACYIGESLGDAGEAFIENVPKEFDAEIEAGLARKAARLAKIQAAAAAAAAAIEQAPAAPMVKASKKVVPSAA